MFYNKSAQCVSRSTQTRVEHRRLVVCPPPSVEFKAFLGSTQAVHCMYYVYGVSHCYASPLPFLQNCHLVTDIVSMFSGCRRSAYIHMAILIITQVRLTH